MEIHVLFDSGKGQGRRQRFLVENGIRIQEGKKESKITGVGISFWPISAI
jgi:hypothetical protein